MNWEATAKNLKVSPAYLRALVRIPLSEHSNLVPFSMLQQDPEGYLLD
jgi:hypothetical protein